jgi:putative transposase
LNPVRAKLVPGPGDYRWSSYTAHASGDTDGTVDFDPWYQSLGTTAEERGKRYAAWVKESIPAGEWEAIRKSIQREGFVGDPRFKEQIEILLGRAVDMRAPGRPRILEK